MTAPIAGAPSTTIAAAATAPSVRVHALGHPAEELLRALPGELDGPLVAVVAHPPGDPDGT